MEKDDLRQHLTFGPDVFGAPRWCDLVGAEAAAGYVRRGAVPVLLDQAGAGLLRNFVHVDDLVRAILAALDEPRARQQLINVCMDEPVDYVRLGDYLARTRGLPPGPHPRPLPLDLARQQQGQVRAGLAATI